jgi:hypothetical protein
MGRTVALVAAALFAAAVPGAEPVRDPDMTPAPRPPSRVVAVEPFVMYTEVYGDGTQLATRRLDRLLGNGISLHPALSSGERALVAGTDLPFIYFSVPEEAGVAPCYPETTDPDTERTIAQLGRPPQSVIRLGMPEFDQSGGCWSRGRPSVDGLGDAEAYATWTDYYLDTKGLAPYLRADAQTRGYLWASLCSYAFCPQYAYDLGSDVVLLERNNDEISGLTPGLAMVRGAARQNGDKPWGIDFSTWRYWNRGPTAFDTSGRLVTGWSPSTFERHLYASFMAGADIVHNEAADYETGAVAQQALNPLGVVVSEFADFALRRHPDRGEPEVSVAVLQDHMSGFEPRYGAFDRARQKWYRQNPYTPGDRMLEAVLDVAYPGYDEWGTVVPEAPWRILGDDGILDVEASQNAFRAALARGADPRLWEPIGSTRWGESLDVITNRARLDTLSRYPVVVLATSAPVSPELAADLSAYAEAGGTVVTSMSQWSESWSDRTGVRPTAERGTADGAVWLVDGAVVAEQEFEYDGIDGGGADIVATTRDGDPLAVRAAQGAGAFYVVAAPHLAGRDGNLLATSVRLLDGLQEQRASVRIAGPPLQYLVTTNDEQITVTLINTDRTGRAWTGEVRFPGVGDAPATVQEWTTDTTVDATRAADGALTIVPTVPPYGVRVFSVTRSG